MHTLIDIGDRSLMLNTPKVMGIVNLTPDSFFDGGAYTNNSRLEERIDRVILEGADIIDLGAYSSRPGASNVSTEEEWKRLFPAIKYIKNKYPQAIISVDTFRSKIADKTYQFFGNFIVNDISGGTFDKNMFLWIQEHKTPYILMHIQGTPQTMQQKPTYKNVVQDVYDFLHKRTEKLYKLGVKDIIIDLGFGFGKTIEHNYALLKNLKQFNKLGFPILTGISRKSMIYKLIDSSPLLSLNGTTVLNTMALERGSKILRVHDVKEAKEAIKLYLELEKY